jgi:hypothetical protein
MVSVCPLGANRGWEEKMIARRTFIKGASMAAITATTSEIHVGQGHAQQVPNSVGIEPPKPAYRSCRQPTFELVANLKAAR